MKRLACLLLLCLPAWAFADPDVRIEARLVPDGEVLVGATLELQVDLLVDTWLTAAPVLANLDLPDAVVGPPSGEAQHLNQRIDGKDFFGLRYSYQITPQTARQYSIPALQFVVQPGQGSGPVTLTSPPQGFVAKSLAGGAERPHLVARQVRLAQTLQRSHEPLRVGDSVTRTVTLQAQGAQAMLMPASGLPEVDGLKRYLQPPVVKPLGDGRGGTDGGMREDSATYVITSAGDFVLPAVDVQWWDYAGAAHHATVEAVSLQAVSAAYHTPFSIQQDLRTLGQQARIRVSEHWLLLAGGMLLVVLAFIGVRRYFPAARSALKVRLARRREAWLASPEYAWKQLNLQMRGQPPQLGALYLWVRRSSGQQTLRDFLEKFAGADEFHLLDFLQIRYGPTPGGSNVLPGLLEELNKVRQQNKRDNPLAAHQGLKPLNP